MLEYRTGNLLQSDAEALVNPVNCVGVMGRGLALQFKKAWPDNFTAYQAACRRGELQPGRMLVFETGQSANPKYLINFPTKRHWRDNSRMEDIDAGLAALADEIRTRRICSVAVPALGSGLGGLDWRDVRTRIEAALGALRDVRVAVFEPRDAFPAPSVTASCAAPAGRHSLETIAALVKSGHIREGMTRAELRALLGDPDDVGGTSRKYREPSLWKYGEVEFAFPNARTAREAATHGLWLVYVDSFEGDPRPFIKLLGPEAKPAGSDTVGK
jgi:O-acetyl-ADP-ribose deacetylase (regulator of RNase III)